MHRALVEAGRNYKKCCLLRKESEALEQRKILEQNSGKALVEVDDLSNSVLDLIDAGKFYEAESVCNELKKRWGKTNLKVPTIRMFKNTAEIEEMIERDHQRELNQIQKTIPNNSFGSDA